MARLLSQLLCGNDKQTDCVLPIISRVTAGDGLDVVVRFIVKYAF